ncbi:MAG: glycosyltransferase 87 family protein [Chthoniobacterales bacterium]
MPVARLNLSLIAKALAALICVACVLAAPWLYFPGDLRDYAMWARATHGLQPWNVYSESSSNYPPLLLYLLTAVEALRRLLHAAPLGAISITLLKLPSLAACALGIPLCRYGLTRVFGEPHAKQAAIAWALCTPLWYNACVWGQSDSLLSLGLIATVIALLNQRVVWAGVALGCAIALKLMAVILVPIAAVFLLRRNGVRALLIASAACCAAWLVVILPFVIAGQSSHVIGAYHGAVGWLPFRQISALNFWYVIDWFDVYVRGLPSDWNVRAARIDTRHFLGLTTYRTLSLALFAGTTLLLVIGLWRRASDNDLALASTLIFFAFFMLTTEMHERYLVPAAGLTVLVLEGPKRILYVGISLAALLNQVLRGAFNESSFADRFAKWQTFCNNKLALDLIVSVASCALFLFAIVWFWRATFDLARTPKARAQSG